MKRHFPFRFLFALLAMILPSCAPPPVTVPIGTVDFMQPGAKRQETLLVFLPGVRDRVGVFADEGFVAALHASGVKADMIGVEAHLGYYLEKKLLPRLKADVIDPAKKEGYRHIWLIGTSLGGFGAVWYDIENPGDLAGIVILAPYLGDPEVVDEVAQAGGLSVWRPAAGKEPDDQHKIWRGLKTYEMREKTENRIYLGYGVKDRFATADGLLAAVLPPEQVFTAKGGHDWPTWNILWQRLLRRLPLER